MEGWEVEGRVLSVDCDRNGKGEQHSESREQSSAHAQISFFMRSSIHPSILCGEEATRQAEQAPTVAASFDTQRNEVNPKCYGPRCTCGVFFACMKINWVCPKKVSFLRV